MNKNILIFFLCFAVAFGGGYLFYKSGQPSDGATQASSHADHETATAPKAGDSTKAEAPAPSAAPATGTASEGAIFTQRGCIACHSVSALNVKGGAVGPDLSQAYVNVKDKHGVPVEEFLKKPTSAVMSGVLGSKPLTEEERQAVLKALKLASEKK